ncbi:hypothetical protein L1887_38561 [Cichorium endivia]|nr:hypothetical protein L1887_38561 [Cichorium endivia]
MSLLNTYRASSSIICPNFNDPLEQLLKLNDFEIQIILDYISHGTHSQILPNSEVELAEIPTILNETQPEFSPSAVTRSTERAVNNPLSRDSSTGDGMFSGGKDNQVPAKVNEVLSDDRHVIHAQRSPSIGYRGIIQRRSGKFTAEIRIPKTGLRKWLGTFKTAEEAAMAYDREAFKLRGCHAILNFPHLIGSQKKSP